MFEYERVCMCVCINIHAQHIHTRVIIIDREKDRHVNYTSLRLLKFTITEIENNHLTIETTDKT